MDFASEQACKFAANGKAQASAAIFSAGAGIRLLKCLEYQFLFLQGDTDAGIRHFKGDHGRRLIEQRMLRGPASQSRRNTQAHTAHGGELEAVRR